MVFFPNQYQKYNVAPPEARTMDGVLFASKMEMNRYAELKLLVRAREIKDLELQPRFLLLEHFKNHGEVHYVADFAYTEVKSGRKVIEEVKGFETRDYKIKAHLFEMKYPQYKYVVTK